VRVLALTAIYPTPERPGYAAFVRTQLESLRRAGVDVDLALIKGRNTKLMYAKAMYELRRRLAATQYDLVHAHYSYAGVVARTQWRVPVVVTYHGDDLLGTVDENGRTTPFSRAVVAAGQMLAELVDAVIVQTEAMARVLRRPDVHVIPHEVDFDVFRPLDHREARVALGLDPGRKYLLFAAPPHIPVKRFPLAREAVERLREHDPTVELLVVFRESQERLALHMNACDALVFPSFQEGSPNIVKQALACNLPIVATDVGDVRQLVGTTPGCVVSEPDAASFARHLRELLARGERTQGRERVRHLDAPRVAHRVIEVYERVLDRPARSDAAGLRRRMRGCPRLQGTTEQP
jgi:glycosyltransferase involved in cell wall biosynthesis